MFVNHEIYTDFSYSRFQNVLLQSINLRESNDITVVTAFIDIGDFRKGSRNNTRTPNAYLKWSETFKYMLNPLVVYTDSQHFYDHMLELRTKSKNKTRVFMFNRTSSWAFQMKDDIKEIFDMKHYPKHYPNTVVPEYTCTTHAKFDVVSRAATNNYFYTKYIMWLDIGYFRYIAMKKQYFKLELPSDFNESRIAVTQVYNVSMSKEPSVIIKGNINWVGGGLFLGKRNIILQFTEEYKTAVDYFRSKKLMNVEQHIIYAMYTTLGRADIEPNIELQIYQNVKYKGNPWFYLGYLMKKDVNSSIV